MPSSNEPRPSVILTITSLAFVAAISIYFNLGNGGQALQFSADGIQNVGATLAPLVAIAAFIERAVEVVIAAARSAGTLELKRRLDVIPADDKAARAAAQDTLDRYKLHTQRYAFSISLGLSLFASMVGVRCVAPLLARSSGAPSRSFNAFDVIITSLLLAGGCDGIHQIVTTITTALDTSKTNNKQKAQAS